MRHSSTDAYGSGGCQVTAKFLPCELGSCRELDATIRHDDTGGMAWADCHLTSAGVCCLAPTP